MNHPWIAELEVPQELVRRLIDDQFPEFNDLPLTLIGEGWDNSAWQVGEDWVFRIPRRQLGADLIASEFAVVPAIARRLPVPVACPLRIGQPTSGYPWPFAGYRLIPGVELCQAAPPVGGRLKLAEELGEFLKSLHSISATEATKLGAPPDRLRRLDIGYRSHQAEEQLTKAANLEIIDSPERWLRLLRQLVPMCSQPESQCLTHGDLYSRHIIVNMNTSDGADEPHTQLAGIIDWGDLHAGDPAIDLSCAWSLFDATGRRRLIESYGSVSSGTLALARLRALVHSTLCLVYGREAKIPDLEQASQDAMWWLLED